LDVESGRVELTTEELQNPTLFQRRVMEKLNIVPPALAKNQWQKILQTLMGGVTVIEAPVDVSNEGQFLEHLERFCTGRAKANTKEEMLLGKPYTQGGRTYFRMVDLLAYLERQHFRELKSNRIAAVLRDIKAEHHFDVIKHRGTNYWSVPEFGQQEDGFPVPNDVREKEKPF
jgi:hypothetical protein